MPTRSISVIADFFQQCSSVFSYPDRKILHESHAGDSFGLNKAGLTSMV